MAVNARLKPVDVKERTAQANGDNKKSFDFSRTDPPHHPLKFQWLAEVGGVIAELDGIHVWVERVNGTHAKLSGEYQLFIGLQQVVFGPPF
jgi:hypothetical protein